MERTFVHLERRNAPGAWHVGSRNFGENVSEPLAWLWAGFIFFVDDCSGEVVGCYSGFLVYADLTRENCKTKTYWEGLMQATAKTFRRCAIHLVEKVTGKHAIEQNFWILPTLFFMQFVNNARYFPEETTLYSEGSDKPRKKNKKYLQLRSPSSPKQFSSYINHVVSGAT